MLHESLVEKVNQTTMSRRNPISAIKPPIKPIKSWEKSEKSLKKNFKFKDTEQRNDFIFQVLSYETVKGHSAKILINDLSVDILLTTKDLNKVTELDKEYSRAIDQIEREVIGVDE